MGILCEYPTGYVEPYPEFFARVALFAEQAAARVAPLEISQAAQIRTFLGQFATTVHKLEKLARKELAAQPFDGDEKKFLKETIRLEQHGGGGCGGPTITYSGWYPTLIYNGAPASWEPTIADVHTGPDGVLEVAVGDVDFLVAAIDNWGDRTAYVGPVYSYYEFESPTRLTDGEWRKRVAASEVPPRPEWVRAFQGKPVQRALPPPKH